MTDTALDDFTPTLRDKLYMRVWYPIRYDWPTTVQRNIAHKMPRWLVYFVTMRAYSVAWTNAGDKEPGELTFDDVMKPWGKPRKKGVR